MRNSVRSLTKAVKTYLATPEGIADPVVSIACTAYGTAANPSFVGEVTFNGLATTIAADSGKVKKFATVEAVLQAFAKIREANDGVYSTSVDTGALFASRVPANIYTAAASKIVSLNKVRAVQVERRDAILALLAGPMLGWDNGNAAQVESFYETTEQKNAVVNDIAAIDAEIVVLQAVVDSAP